jgi:hypothetical protein
MNGCSGSSETGGEGGQGGDPLTTASGDGSYTSEDCFAWPLADAGGGGGAGGEGTGGSASGAGGAGGANGAGGAGGGDAAMCPSKSDAAMYLTPSTCGGETMSDATFKDGQCCYSVYHYGCGTGRPFLVGREAAFAAPRRGEAAGSGARARAGGWTDEGGKTPDLAALTPSERARLAATWTRDGLLEHASVASFGRFALELMAAGAPADLVDLAHRAALDEIRHARLCLGLASAYAGEVIEPARFPFGGRVDIEDDLAAIAARAASEGCVGETLAAVLAAEQHAAAKDEAVRGVLAVIAEDEARHAELAWRAVAWACRAGGERVRRAVGEAIENAIAALSSGESRASDASGALEAHGLLSETARRGALARAAEDVVRPAAKALLDAAGRVMEASPALPVA